MLPTCVADCARVPESNGWKEAAIFDSGFGVDVVYIYIDVSIDWIPLVFGEGEGDGEGGSRVE